MHPPKVDDATRAWLKLSASGVGTNREWYSVNITLGSTFTRLKPVRSYGIALSLRDGWLVLRMQRRYVAAVNGML